MAARDRELEPAAPGVLLEPRGRVQDVAHEDDLPLQVAEPSSHHGPAVQPAAGARHGAERGAIARGAARGLVPNPEEAVHAVGVAQAALLPPGHDHLVARVPIALAFGLDERVAQLVDDPPQQLVAGLVAKALRELRRRYAGVPAWGE